MFSLKGYEKLIEERINYELLFNDEQDFVNKEEFLFKFILLFESFLISLYSFSIHVEFYNNPGCFLKNYFF